MSLPQRAVQSCHAVLESTKQGTDWEQHPYVVLLGVDTECDLWLAYYRAEDAGIKCAIFKEPDLDGEATAFATVPMLRSTVFKKLSLMGDSKCNCHAKEHYANK